MLYDGACAFCIRMLRPIAGPLRRRGFIFTPLQEVWVAERLGIHGAELLREMRVLTREGAVFGGADAVVYLLGRFWWGRPLELAAKIPGTMLVIRRLYRFIARSRYCISNACGLRLDARGGQRSAFL